MGCKRQRRSPCRLTDVRDVTDGRVSAYMRPKCVAERLAWTPRGSGKWLAAACRVYEFTPKVGACSEQSRAEQSRAEQPQAPLALPCLALAALNQSVVRVLIDLAASCHTSTRHTQAPFLPPRQPIHPATQPVHFAAHKAVLSRPDFHLVRRRTQVGSDRRHKPSVRLTRSPLSRPLSLSLSLRPRRPPSRSRPLSSGAACPSCLPCQGDPVSVKAFLLPISLSKPYHLALLGNCPGAPRTRSCKQIAVFGASPRRT